MAIDSNIALGYRGLDAVTPARQGFQLGAGIAQNINQTRDRKKQEAQDRAIKAFSAWGSDQLTEENLPQFNAVIAEMGYPPVKDIAKAQTVLTAGGNLFNQQMKAGGRNRRVQNSAELGGGAMQILYSDGSTEVITPTPEQRAAIAVAQQENITYEQALNKARGKGKELGTSEAIVETSESVGSAEADKAGKKKTAEVVAEYTAKIAKAPELAEKIAIANKRGASRGDNIVSLDEQRANMPMLEDTVATLKELAPLATHTMVGRLYNAGARELGFKVPEGATARVAYQGTIDNVVLPLLKATFGAQFTEKEGAKLAATLGDVNVSPEEKVAALDAFMTQKRRELEMAERKVITVDEVDNMTDEEVAEQLRKRGL